MVVKDLLMQCMVDDIIKAVLKKEDENVNVIVRVQVQAWTAVNVFPIL